MKPAIVGAIDPPKHIEGLQPYEPGVGIEEARRLSGRERIARLGSNENPPGFVCFDAGRDAGEVFEALLAQGVIVRPFRREPFPTWIRVSIGSPEDDDLFPEALAALRRTR